MSFEKRFPGVLWARRIDERFTAIVIDTGYGALLGGVIELFSFDMDVGYSPYYGASSTLKFRWLWRELVDTPEEFERQRRWETEVPQLASPIKLIEGKP